MITLALSPNATAAATKIAESLVKCLSSKGLITSYVRSVELTDRGNLHIHLVASTAGAAANDVRSALEKWLQLRNARGHFTADSTADPIDVQPCYNIPGAVSYVCKGSPNFGHSDKLPAKRIATSQDLQLKQKPLKPLPKLPQLPNPLKPLPKLPNPLKPKQSPRSHARKTWDNPDCGRHVTFKVRRRINECVRRAHTASSFLFDRLVQFFKQSICIDTFAFTVPMLQTLTNHIDRCIRRSLQQGNQTQVYHSPLSTLLTT